VEEGEMADPGDLIGPSEWIRPKAWKMDWELRKGVKVLATISSPGFFGTSVRATVDDKGYIIRKGGLRKPGAALTRSGDRVPLALMEFDALGKGTVRFASGSIYQWQRTTIEGEWTMSQEGRGSIFTVLFDTRAKYPSGKVLVDIIDPWMGELLVLAWFLISTTEC
jgi:hypothetical protein